MADHNTVEQTGHRDVRPGFDPFDPGTLRHLYETLEALRGGPPVFWSPELALWVVTDPIDIKEVMSNGESYSATAATAPFHQLNAEARQILADVGFQPSLFSSDGDKHHAVRRHVARAFTPRRISSLEPFVEALVNAHIDRLSGRDDFDLLKEVFDDLPARVILRLLGVPDSDSGRIIAGSRNRVTLVFGRPSDTDQVQIAREFAEFWQYVSAMVTARAGEPADDLASALLQVRAGADEGLTMDDITSILVSFFSAGYETTTSLLTNGFRHLLSDRDRLWQSICEDPDLIPNTVEELLRFDSSIFAWRRVTVEDVVLGGTTIPSGSQVLALLGEGNRSPEMFEAADEIRLQRADASRHAAFGYGAHYCIGAALARLQARVALQLFSRRLPQLRLAGGGEVGFMPNISLRTPLGLPVSAS